MKLISNKIVWTNSSGNERKIDILMLKNLKANRRLRIKGYRMKVITSITSIYYKRKKISIYDLTNTINNVIIAVVK